MIRIYVSGPLTLGDVEINVRTAINAAEKLLTLGYAPYVPHLTHFWHMQFPHDHSTWLALDEEWLKVCDTVLRLPGESVGADREIAFATQHGIPVFHFIDDLTDCYGRRGGPA